MNENGRKFAWVALLLGVAGLLYAVSRPDPLAPPAASPPAASQAASSASEAGAPDPAVAPGEVSVGSLLEETVDLLALARLPDPFYRTLLASSYDRRSVSPDDAAGWFANDDWLSAARPNEIRVEVNAGRREHVLLDVEGPGALVRLWTATPAGTLRLYLDGSAAPALEARTEELLSGKGPIPEPFAYVAARGYSAYFPFPYRKHCKVTVDEIVAADPFKDAPLEKFYYQINYRTYARETAPRVRTFRRDELRQLGATLSRIGAVLEHPWMGYQPRPGMQRLPMARNGGGLGGVLTAKGGGVIREILLFRRNPDDAALARARVRMTFDGETSVEAPLSDFFGTSSALSGHDTLPLSVGSDGSLVSRWPMPFRERASIEILDAAGLEGEIAVEPFEFDARTLYFHARFRDKSSVRSQPPRDLEVVRALGSGRLVGIAFSVTNPVEKWWGEGDEKIYVDGERFPSWFGTGTEDYFGYAWSTAELFTRAFHAQTRADGPGFSGSWSMRRFHVLDAIPFSNELRFDLELWHWDDARVTWSALAFYYARPGAR